MAVLSQNITIHMFYQLIRCWVYFIRQAWYVCTHISKFCFFFHFGTFKAVCMEFWENKFNLIFITQKLWFIFTNLCMFQWLENTLVIRMFYFLCVVKKIWVYSFFQLQFLIKRRFKSWYHWKGGVALTSNGQSLPL